MKKFFKVLGIIALVAIIGFSFPACGDDGGGNMTWTDVTDGRFNSYLFSVRAIAFGNGKFVASIINGKMVNSTDGKTWTVVMNGGNNDNIYAIAYGNGKFVAGGDNKMATSTDGETWTAVADIGTSYINAIAYGNGKFVAGGDNKMATSTDGATWTTVDLSSIFSTDSSSNEINAIAYGNNKFVAVGCYNYSGLMVTSTDGTTWTDVSSNIFKGESIRAIAYGNGKFVAGGDIGKMALSTGN